MNDPGCALIWFAVFFIAIVYMNYQAWFKPIEHWHKQRGRIACHRSQTRNSLPGLFMFDPFDFEDRQGRHIWWSRLALGSMLAIAILGLLSSIAENMRQAWQRARETQHEHAENPH